MQNCKCEAVVKLINDGINYEKYQANLRKLDALEREGVLELYAGDSYLDDVEEHYRLEDRYTINHHYRCKHCGRTYFIGFCCRGGFIFKEIDCLKEYGKRLEDINFEHIMEGKERLGVRFQNGRRYRRVKQS